MMVLKMCIFVPNSFCPIVADLVRFRSDFMQNVGCKSRKATELLKSAYIVVRIRQLRQNGNWEALLEYTKDFKSDLTNVSEQEVKKAKSFNLSTKIASVNAIALGVSDVIPIEITSSYATIANKGIYNEPISITHIKDQHGRVIKHFVSEQLEVVNEPTNYIMLDMMKDVVDSGTGSKIRWKYKFNAPMAGKTGTTNNKTDAWFIGFTPQIVIGIWIGVDDPSIPLGKRQYGSVAALPIFADAIKDIYDHGSFHSGSKIVYLDNKEDWSQPNGVVEVKICTETLKKANDKWCKSTNEIYLENHIPNQNCDKHINAFTKYKK